MKNHIYLSFILSLIILSVSAQKKEPAKPIVVDAKQIVATIQPNMWGVFFEDINFAADGGLYAELVKNRSFEFTYPKTGWREYNSGENLVQILNRSNEKPSNPRYARVNVTTDKPIGLSNEGFRGMGIKKYNEYNFSIWARVENGTSNKFVVEIVGQDSSIIARGEVSVSGTEWKKYTAQLKSTASCAKATMNLWFDGKGVYDVDMISLFPKDTWKGRSNGLRADLVQILADMKPGFIRFPGGCIVEGYTLEQRYQWKKTIGNVEDRELIINRWNTEFKHRLTPDYFQSYGLGFFEYFQLCDDIGAEPLPILNCGMACQFNSGESVVLDDLDTYVQDALDLIEFANGSEQTQWGKIRAEMGHPEPFNLKMLGVGNENWGPQYIDRLEIFQKALKEKYPQIKIVGSSGTSPDGDRFEFLNTSLRKMKIEIIDEHYYRNYDWFLKNANRYDSYDRNSSKVFAGEYAASPNGNVAGPARNQWGPALSEAAFLTGLERNADVVHMASYAPMFAHVDAWQWAPDMIWFDNMSVYGSPSYYVQKMYSTNKGTHAVSVLANKKIVAGADSIYASATIDKQANELIIKLVNVSSESVAQSVALKGVAKINNKGTMLVLQNNDFAAQNSIENPKNVYPVEKNIDVKGKKLDVDMAPYSFCVIKLKVNF